LALINENARPPIAKLMDYGKFIYDQTKQVAKQKAKAHGPELKEVRFGIKIDEHDLEVKTNQVRRFLERGDKVKISVQLKGREMMFRQKAFDLIGKIKKDVNGAFEKPVERMGNRFFATITREKNETKNN